MDYDQLKVSLKEIAEIASSVPEQFRDKCFELLLSNLLRQDDGQKGKEKEKQNASDGDSKSDKGSDSTPGKIPITTQMRVLMRRTKVTEDQLNKIILYDKDAKEVHFVKQPTTKGVTTGQMEWALLLALKNVIVNDTLATDPEELRSVCQETGYYDKTNFGGTLKRNAKLFKKPLVKQGPEEPLSSDGQDALGELIKRMASEGDE